MPLTLRRLLPAIAATLWLVACGGAPPTDALDAAQAAFDNTELAERCAEAEFRAARNLLAQANEAYTNREYDRARQLADAARLQAERAEQIAEENRENCDLDAAAEEVALADPEPEPERDIVDDDYEWTAVYFEFNASTLSPDSRRTLEAHAEAMRANPSIRLVLEGHCDQRGTMEYNFALGERRARTVRDYLARLNVAPERLSTVSYGAERPNSTDNSENRRVEFRPR